MLASTCHLACLLRVLVRVILLACCVSSCCVAEAAPVYLAAWCHWGPATQRGLQPARPSCIIATPPCTPATLHSCNSPATLLQLLHSHAQLSRNSPLRSRSTPSSLFCTHTPATLPCAPATLHTCITRAAHYSNSARRERQRERVAAQTHSHR